MLVLICGHVLICGQALALLRQRTYIIIELADKGSATVVMARKDYLAKVMNHLDNTQFYEQLPYDPTERFSEEIRTCLINMLNRLVIDEDTFNFL